MAALRITAPSNDNNSDITATLWLKWGTDLSEAVAFCTAHEGIIRNMNICQ